MVMIFLNRIINASLPLDTSSLVKVLPTKTIKLLSEAISQLLNVIVLLSFTSPLPIRL